MIIYGTIMSNGICRDNVDLQGDSGGSKGKPLSNCREIVLKSANFDVYCTRCYECMFICLNDCLAYLLCIVYCRDIN